MLAKFFLTEEQIVSKIGFLLTIREMICPLQRNKIHHMTVARKNRQILCFCITLIIRYLGIMA